MTSRSSSAAARIWDDGDQLARLTADAEQIKARYPQARSALLPMLHLVQSEEGYVSPSGIAFCAERLGLAAAEVSAVATFYTQYKRHPNGTYTVGVCTNALCAVMGGDAIFAEVSEHLDIGHDETTGDGAVTLERIECNAACDYAPVVMVNWEFFDNQTPQSTRDLVDALRAGQRVAPTRGAARVGSFREVSRVLAGFPDGRADEGTGVGTATLAGLRLARERGWTAPAGDRSEAPAGGEPTDLTSGYGAPRDATADDAGRQRETSAHDAGAVPDDEGSRVGTTAGKPAADATQTGTDPAPTTQTPNTSTPSNGSQEGNR